MTDRGLGQLLAGGSAAFAAAGLLGVLLPTWRLPSSELFGITTTEVRVWGFHSAGGWVVAILAAGAGAAGLMAAGSPRRTTILRLAGALASLAALVHAGTASFDDRLEPHLGFYLTTGFLIAAAVTAIASARRRARTSSPW